MYGTIVAGTDLSSTARRACARAATLARPLGAQLVLLYAGRDPGASLEQLGEELGAKTHAAQGEPAEVLVEQSAKLGADLLVVGSVGMSGAKRFLLGSVPNKVSHHAATDLLIVKTDSPSAGPDEYERILVGTDGSPTAMRAVDMASRLAAKLGVRPTIVCAFEPPTEDEMDRLRSDPNDPVAQWDAGRVVRETPDEFKWRIAGAAHADDILDRAADRAAKAGADPEVKVLEGSPAETLIASAEEEGFDLICVGNVGMAGAKRFKLGNVPHRVSHHATTDVLILKTT
jgi:nucleotide-binding universal stress UspA family protein